MKMATNNIELMYITYLETFHSSLNSIFRKSFAENVIMLKNGNRGEIIFYKDVIYEWMFMKMSTNNIELMYITYLETFHIVYE